MVAVSAAWTDRSEQTQPSTVLCAREMANGSAHERMRTLVADHFRFVWRLLRRLGVPEADVDDATQETFMVAMRRLTDIRPGCERAFFCATALRVASGWRRSRDRHQRRLELAASVPVSYVRTPEQVIEHRRQLDALLGELDLNSRAVFVLFELEELTTREIAELLGMKVATVASRLGRARKKYERAVGRLRHRGALPGGDHA
jgi:RNA polymerase sigma-70 factor, ECF subfamily